MVNDEPQNDSSQQVESVESLSLAALLENPDPDFDVVVTQRSQHVPSRIERATDENRPAPPYPESKQS